MVQFQILSGKSAGVSWDARRFPVRIGRASGNDLQLADDGVWNEHFEVALNRGDGFVLSVQPGALVTVNQTPASTPTRLRSGDLITAGSAQICFRLSETRQRGLRLREWFVWMLVLGVILAEAALIGWLLQ
jgi:pSer/pThr/pTyr-binding forkhead associated (FHA) protein